MRLRELWLGRKQTWIQRRHPRLPRCVTGRRTIYILPSRAGVVMLFFLLFVFLLAANYQNALVFGLFFWLVALAVLNLHMTHHNMAAVSTRCIAVRNGEVGGAVEFDLEVSREDGRPRHALDLIVEEELVVHSISLDEAASQVVTVSVPVNQRGYVLIPRITLRSVYPLGIARTWSYAHLAACAVAYPIAVDAGIPVQGGDGQLSGVAASSVPGVNDFESLRAFVPGDRLSRVHWPASTRSSVLQVKQFVDPLVHDEWIRWDDYCALSVELRLQHMTSLIEQMESQRLSYGVELPGVSLSPSVGTGHYHLCRKALATHGLAEPRFD